jgi:hypothetical protein
VLSQGFGRRLGSSLTGGATPSAREGREKRTALEKGSGGPWAICGAGPKGSPRTFLNFFVCSFLFLFAISFISFAKELQLKPNQNLKFSKIQSNLLI